MSHIRVRVGKLRTHLQYIDASAASLQVQKSEYDSMSVRRRQRALDRGDLRWVGQRWDVLRRPDVRQMVHEARTLAFECVQSWCHSVSSLQLDHMFPQRWFFTDRTILKQYKVWKSSDRQYRSTIFAETTTTRKLRGGCPGKHLWQIYFTLLLSAVPGILLVWTWTLLIEYCVTHCSVSSL